MTGKPRGRVSFAGDDFAGSTSLTTLPEVNRAPTSARLDDLAHNPNNPPERYHGDGFDELVESLREVGQLQPVTVVGRDVFLAHHPDADVESARFVVVMGNRRLAGARRAGLDRLDIVVKDHLGGNDPRLTEAALMENLHREVFPPLLEARELAALVDKHGSQSAVAKRLAKTPAWVSQRLGLLKLTPELQEQLHTGRISFRDARLLSATPPQEQVARLAELRAGALAAPDVAPQQRPGSDEPADPPAGIPEAAEPSPTDGPAKRRRGRPPRPTDVETIARDLRRRLSDDDLALLVERISTELGR